MIFGINSDYFIRKVKLGIINTEATDVRQSRRHCPYYWRPCASKSCKKKSAYAKLPLDLLNVHTGLGVGNISYLLDVFGTELHAVPNTSSR